MSIFAPKKCPFRHLWEMVCLLPSPHSLACYSFHSCVIFISVTLVQKNGYFFCAPTYTVKSVKTDTCVIRFTVLSKVDFHYHLSIFLYFLHNIIWHPVYSDTKFLASACKIIPFMFQCLLYCRLR